MEKTISKPDAPSLYQPLKTGEYLEIRLLTMLPAQAEDPIKCILRIVSLDNPPEYDSVSYVWGNVNDRTTIQVSSDKDSTPREISIPKSAANSLLRLRLEAAPRTLWIDVVCICCIPLQCWYCQNCKNCHVKSSAQHKAPEALLHPSWSHIQRY